MMKRTHYMAAFSLIAALAIPMVAQATSHSTLPEPARARTALTDGEVRKVDKDAKKLTIHHGPIQNLDMPAMTMVFQVADPAVLDRVKPGDKVKFSADKVGGAYTVTTLEVTK